MTLLSQWLENVTPGTTGDLVADGQINLADFTLFAANWQHIQGNPDLSVSILEDVEGFPETLIVDSEDASFYKLPRFVLMDGQWIGGTTELGDIPPSIEAQRYLNGQHELKIATVSPGGSITLSSVQNVIFDNPLYCVQMDDYFHPDDDYRIVGLHNGTIDFELTLTDVNDVPIWSDTITADSSGVTGVDVAIPNTTFTGQQLCTIAMSNATPVGGMSTLSENEPTKRDLVRKYKWDDTYSQNARMVIIIPNKDIFRVRRDVVRACAKACNDRNVGWVPLYYHDVTEINLLPLLMRQTMRYVYWCGHGNSNVGQTPEEEQQGTNGGVVRTNMACYKHIETNWWPDKWRNVGAFSWTRRTVPNAIPLPNDYDECGLDLSLAWMWANPTKRIVFVDACRSAVYDDMAVAFGIGNSGNNDQVYIGWKKDVTVSGKREKLAPRNFTKYTSKTNAGIKLFWERMGAGDTVYQALEATTNLGETSISIWGTDGQMDLAGIGPNEWPENEDTIRVIGMGVFQNKLN